VAPSTVPACRQSPFPRNREVDPWQNTADVIEEAGKGDAECAISGGGLERAKSDPESLRGLGGAVPGTPRRARRTITPSWTRAARIPLPPFSVAALGRRPFARGSTGDDGLCHAINSGPDIDRVTDRRLGRSWWRESRISTPAAKAAAASRAALTVKAVVYPWTAAFLDCPVRRAGGRSDKVAAARRPPCSTVRCERSPICWVVLTRALATPASVGFRPLPRPWRTSGRRSSPFPG